MCCSTALPLLSTTPDTPRHSHRCNPPLQTSMSSKDLYIVRYLSLSLSCCTRGCSATAWHYLFSPLEDWQQGPPLDSSMVAAICERGFQLLCLTEDSRTIACAETLQDKQLFSSIVDTGANCISFHPTNNALLCTTGHGGAALWHVPKHAVAQELQAVPLHAPGKAVASLYVGLHVGCMYVGIQAATACMT